MSVVAQPFGGVGYHCGGTCVIVSQLGWTQEGNFGAVPLGDCRNPGSSVDTITRSKTPLSLAA